MAWQTCEGEENAGVIERQRRELPERGAVNRLKIAIDLLGLVTTFRS